MSALEKILIFFVIILVLFVFYKPPKIWNDTLRPKGSYEQKRVMSFSSFFLGSIYAFIPIVVPNFEVKDFVVWAFFSLAGGSAFIVMREKFIGNSNNTNKEEPL